jgi:hypothetical protein
VFGDFGGVQYVLMLIGGYIVGGASEFIFTIKAIQKLFLAKTRDDKVFPEATKKKVLTKRRKFEEVAKSQSIDRKLSKKMKENRIIKFSYPQ